MKLIVYYKKIKKYMFLLDPWPSPYHFFQQGSIKKIIVCTNWKHKSKEESCPCYGTVFGLAHLAWAPRNIVDIMIIAFNGIRSISRGGVLLQVLHFPSLR